MAFFNQSARAYISSFVYFIIRNNNWDRPEITASISSIDIKADWPVNHK